MFIKFHLNGICGSSSHFNFYYKLKLQMSKFMLSSTCISFQSEIFEKISNRIKDYTERSKSIWQGASTSHGYFRTWYPGICREKTKSKVECIFYLDYRREKKKKIIQHLCCARLFWAGETDKLFKTI